MKIEEQHTYEKVILGLELIGFALVIGVIWLDELITAWMLRAYSIAPATSMSSAARA